MRLVDTGKTSRTPRPITREQILFRAQERGRFPLRRGLIWLVEHQDHEGSECLTWPFYRSKVGYGRTCFEGRVTFPHRIMCILAYGNPPTAEHIVSHTCNAGHLGCVNPRHLQWATTRENHQYKCASDRQPTGSRAFNSKLTAEQVRLIRAQVRSPDEITAAARKYQVHRKTVLKLLRRASYRAEA